MRFILLVAVLLSGCQKTITVEVREWQGNSGLVCSYHIQGQDWYSRYIDPTKGETCENSLLRNHWR